MLQDLGEEATGNGRGGDGEEDKMNYEATCIMVNFCDDEQCAYLALLHFYIFKMGVHTTCSLSYLMGGEILKNFC